MARVRLSLVLRHYKGKMKTSAEKNKPHQHRSDDSLATFETKQMTMLSYFLIGNSITLTLIFILFIYIGYSLYSMRQNNIFRRLGIPSPDRVPLLGEMIKVARKGIYLNDIELVQKYGPIVGIYEGMIPIILVSDLDLLRKVLIKDSHLFINRRTLENASGPFKHGLTVLKDDAWKNVRSIVSPTFSSAKLKAMFGLMNEICDRYNKRLLDYADKQEDCDCKELNGQFTLDSIASCLFGIETNSLQNENLTLINHLKTFFKINFKNPFLLIFLLSPKLANYLGSKGISLLPNDAIDYVTRIVDDVIARRRNHSERRNDFIQIMIDHEQEESNQDETTSQKDKVGLKKTLTDKEILAQALIFLIAGYETTSSMMSFFFYVMATEPEIQEKVYAEIQQEMGDEEDVTMEKLNQMTYLEMVMQETLRMYPPFIRFDRVASTDYQLGEYLIPKDSILNVPVYPIHHDPKHWPDPEKFIPERFSPSEKANRHPMAFLPFGDGPRNCIGMRFALLEAKLAIAKALRVVEIQKSEVTKVPLELGKLGILASKDPIRVRLVRRSQ